MKEMLLRLRHWLIKKLGGYTEQMAPPVVRYLPRVALHPERVYAQMRVNNEMLGDSRDVWKGLSKRAKEELTWKIAQGIIANDYAVLTCEPDWRHDPRWSVYTMMLCILPPNEWMKTTMGDCMAPCSGYGRMGRDVI